MRERRGRIGRTVGALADSLASAARRSGGAQGEARVVIYDAAGHSTLLPAGEPEHERIVAIAERIIGLWQEPGEGEG